MSADPISVDGLDHVSLVVSDRFKAAKWYEQALGFAIVEAFEPWAEDPDGPLMISSDDGETMLALFEGNALPADHRHVAFRTAGGGFLGIVDRLYQRPDTDIGELVDHDLAFSIYFADPDGNRLEVTTYDYAPIAPSI